MGSLPSGWTHAEINVTLGGSPHTLVLNNGRVQAASPTSLTLREADGSVAVVPVSTSTQVIVNGQPSQITNVVVGADAVTMQVDGSPAQRVQANVPQSLLANALGKVRKHRG